MDAMYNALIHLKKCQLCKKLMDFDKCFNQVSVSDVTLLGLLLFCFINISGRKLQNDEFDLLAVAICPVNGNNR